MIVGCVRRGHDGGNELACEEEDEQTTCDPLHHPKSVCSTIQWNSSAVSRKGKEKEKADRTPLAPPCRRNSEALGTLKQSMEVRTPAIRRRHRHRHQIRRRLSHHRRSRRHRSPLHRRSPLHHQNRRRHPLRRNRRQNRRQSL